MSCSYCQSRKRDVATCACGDVVCGLCFYPRISPPLFRKMVSNKGKDSQRSYACDACCQDMHALCLICEQPGDLVKCISCRGAFHTRCHRMDRCTYCFKASQDKDAKVLVSWCVDLFGKTPGKCIRVKGNLQGMPSQYYESSNVIHAIEPNVLVGRDFVVHLRGSMCRRLSAMSYVMPVVAQSFEDGFPPGWKKVLKDIAQEAHKTIDVESPATQPASTPQPTLLQRLLRAKPPRNKSPNVSMAPAHPSASSSASGSPFARHDFPRVTAPAQALAGVSRSPDTDPIEEFTSCSGTTSFGPARCVIGTRESIGTFSPSSNGLSSAQAQASPAPAPIISNTVISISDSPGSSSHAAEGSAVQAASSDEVVLLAAHRDKAETREIEDSELASLERTVGGIAPTEIMSDHEQALSAAAVDSRDEGQDNCPVARNSRPSASLVTTTEENQENVTPVHSVRRTLARVLSFLTPTEIVSDGGKLSVGAPMGTLDCGRSSLSSLLDKGREKESAEIPAEKSACRTRGAHAVRTEHCTGANAATPLELCDAKTQRLPSDPCATSPDKLRSSPLSSTEIPHHVANSPTTMEQHPLDPPPTIPNTSLVSSSQSPGGHQVAAHGIAASPTSSSHNLSYKETLESTPFMSTLSLERDYDCSSIKDNDEEGARNNVVQKDMSPGPSVSCEHPPLHNCGKCPEEDTLESTPFMSTLSLKRDYEVDDSDNQEDNDQRGGCAQGLEGGSDNMQSPFADDTDEFHSARSKTDEDGEKEKNNVRRGLDVAPSSQEDSDEMKKARREAELEELRTNGTDSEERGPIAEAAERGLVHCPSSEDEESENGVAMEVHDVARECASTDHLAVYEDANFGRAERDSSLPLCIGEVEDTTLAHVVVHEESEHHATTPTHPYVDTIEEAREDALEQSPREVSQHALTPLSCQHDRVPDNGAPLTPIQHDVERPAATSYPPSVSNASGHQDGATVTYGATTHASDLSGAVASAANVRKSSDLPPSTSAVSRKRPRSVDHATFQSMPSLLTDSTNSLSRSSQSPKGRARRSNPRHVVSGASNFPQNQLVHCPDSPASRTTDSILRASTVPLSWTNNTSDGYSPYPLNPSLAHKISESVSPHPRPPSLRVPGLDFCLSSSNSAILKAPALLDLSHAAPSVSLWQDDANQREEDMSDARAAKRGHSTHSPLPLQSASDVGASEATSPLGSACQAEIGVPPLMKLSELSASACATSPSSLPFRNQANTRLSNTVDACRAQLSKEGTSEREVSSKHTLRQEAISLISSEASGSQSSPGEIALARAHRGASEVNNQNNAVVSAVNEPMQGVVSQNIDKSDSCADAGTRIRAEGDASRAGSTSGIEDEEIPCVTIHAGTIVAGDEIVGAEEIDGLQTPLIDANCAGSEPLAPRKSLAASATPVRQQGGASCCVEKPRERKSQAMLWKEMRTQICPPSTRQRSSSSDAPAASSPKRRKNASDSLSTPLSPSLQILSAPTEIDTQNQSAQTVCTNQDVVVTDLVHDKRATEAKVYEELVDIVALRWYVHLKVDRRQPVAEEFLTMAEKAAHRGTLAHNDPHSSIRRIPMTYHRSVDMGRRYADRTSLQTVTRECRAAASGSLLCDIDISNCYPVLITQMVDKCMRAVGKPLLKLPTLRRYITAREDLLATVTCRYGVSRDVAKNLFLRLLYGGTISSWRDEFAITAGMDIPLLFSFQKDAADATRAIVASRPEVVARFAKKRDTVRSVENCALAYILGETEDLIVSTCEEVLEREDVRVSVVVFDGLMVDMSSVTEEDLVHVLRKARNEIKEKLGFSVMFERKLLVGCSMQARMAALGGSAHDILVGKEHDTMCATMKQKVFDMCSTKKKARVSLASAPKKKKSRGMIHRVRSRSLIDVDMEGAHSENKKIGCTLPWTADEKKLYSTAIRKLDISDPSFWHTLSTRVGRTVEECKQYYNAQRSCSGSKKAKKRPAKRAGPLPKTDCALRVKSVRETLQEDFRHASAGSSAMADCFRPSEGSSNVVLDGLDEIALTPLNDVAAPERVSITPSTISDSDANADFLYNDKPQNLHNYIHSRIQLKNPKAKKRDQMSPALPRPLSSQRPRSFTRRRSSNENVLKEFLRKEDQAAEKDRYEGSDWESDFDIAECSDI